MTLSRQSPHSGSAANLTVRAVRLGGAKSLEEAVDASLAQGLHGARGVVHWKKTRASHGEYEGFETLLERRYSSGLFKVRGFGFLRGKTVFLVEHAAPTEQFEQDPEALGRFVRSLKFETAQP